MVHPLGGDIGQTLQLPAHRFQRLSCQVHLFHQVTGDIVLPLHHQKGSHRDLCLHVLTAQDGRDKAGQTHGAEVDILSAETLRLCHAVDLGADALLLPPAGQAADLTGGTAVAALIPHLSGGVGHHTPYAAGSGNGPCARPGQCQIKGLLLPHLPFSFPACSAKMYSSRSFFQHSQKFLDRQDKRAKKYQNPHLFTRVRPPGGV